MAKSRIKLVDRMALWVEAELDVPALLQSYFPDYIPPDSNVECPFHDDKDPSLHISESGACYCHGCGWRTKNVIELFAKMEEVSYLEARDALYQELVKWVPHSVVGSYIKALTRRKTPQTYLHNRGLDDNTIKLFSLGYEPGSGRITIPVYDQFGTCVNVRRFAWDRTKEHKHRVLNIPDHGEVRLYPENLLVRESKVLLVEGEWDTLIGRQYKIPTCTWTGGANSWSSKHEWLLRDKVVFVRYDNDPEGRRSQTEVVRRLTRLALQVVPLDPLLKEGKDLSDWALADHTKVQFLCDDVKGFVPMKRKPTRCPHCGQKWRK